MRSTQAALASCHSEVSNNVHAHALLVTPVHNRPAPSLFALVIGINQYLYFSPLSGAVADVEDLKTFLTTSLHVPPDNISTLVEEQATKAAIEKELLCLATDSRIQWNDAILIYYAGHGARAGPQSWSHGRRISMICPYDMDPCSTDYTVDQAVTGFTLSGILAEIAKNKGDNIVRLCVTTDSFTS